MLEHHRKFIVRLCDFLSDEEKVTLLTCNNRLRNYLKEVLFKELTPLSKIFRLNYYQNFTDIIFDMDINFLPANIRYGTYRYTCKPAVRRTLHTTSKYYPANITYVNDGHEDDDKITVNFAKPVRKTRFPDINNIRCATYVGKIDMFDIRKGSPDLMAKFYIAYDDLDRFRNLLGCGVSLDDYELLLHVRLMRQTPPRIFTYILDHTTNAASAQFIEYLKCVMRLGMPLEVRKMITTKHAEMFWTDVYDKIGF